MMEVVESSHLASSPPPPPIVFLSLSLFLSLPLPLGSSRLPSQSSPGPGPLPAVPVSHWPAISAGGPGGVTMGLRGAEVGGRGPQRRRRALHMLVPLWRVHLCQPRNDRRLEGRLAADGNGLSLRCSREGVLGGGGGGGGRLAGGTEAPRAAATHKEQSCAL